MRSLRYIERVSLQWTLEEKAGDSESLNYWSIRF